MAEHKTRGSLPANAVARPAVGNSKTARVRASSFKYYIHDSCPELRLKLIGEMTQADIGELNGCWRTAKTTLAKRKLVLDLRSLKMIDEAARHWVAQMSEAGACCVPEDFLATCVPGQRAPDTEADMAGRKIGLFNRLAALFRGAAVSAAGSSTTQAQ